MENPVQAEDSENIEGMTAQSEMVTADESESSGGDEGFVPKGALGFSLVLIGGYIIYYFLIWSEVVLLRGGS